MPTQSYIPFWFKLAPEYRDREAVNFKTRKELECWRGNALAINFGVFFNSLPSDLSNLAYVKMEVRTDDKPTGTVLVSKQLNLADLTPVITAAGFDAFTERHGCFLFENADTSLDLGAGAAVKKFYFVFLALTAAGREQTYGAGWLSIFEDAAGGGDPPPPVPPSAYYTEDEVNALFAARAPIAHLTDDSAHGMTAPGRALLRAADVPTQRTALSVRSAAEEDVLFAAEVTRATAAENQLAASRAPLQGLNLDGSNYATLTNGQVIGLGKYTFDFGFIVSSYLPVAGGLLGGAYGSPIVYINSNGKITFGYVGGNVYTTTYVFALNTHYVLDVVRTGLGANQTLIYVNGVFIEAFTDGTSYSAGYATVGSNGFSSSFLFIGTINRVRILNRALSAAEVATLFKTGQLIQVDTYGGSMTPYSLGTFVAYTEYGADGTTFSAGSTTGFTLAAVSSSGTQSGGIAGSVPSKRSKRFRVSFSLAINSGSLSNLYATLRVPSSGFDAIYGAATFTISGSGVYTGEIVADNGFDRSTYLVILGGTGTFNITISSVSIIPLGALLLPDAAHLGCGPQWRDVSGNQCDIILPGDGRSNGVTWSQPSREAITIRVPLTTGYAWGVGAPCIPAGYVLKEAFAGATATGTLSLGGSSSDTTRLINAQALTASRPITLAADRVTSTSSLYLSGSGLGGNLYLTFGPA